MKFKFTNGSLNAPILNIGTEDIDFNILEFERSENLAAFESCMIDINIFSNIKGFEAEDSWYKKLWDKIKAIFKAIGNWLLSVWNWILSKFRREGTLEVGKTSKEEVKVKKETINKTISKIKDSPNGVSEADIEKDVSKLMSGAIATSPMNGVLKDLQTNMEEEVKKILLEEVTEENENGNRVVKRNVINTHLSYYIFDKDIMSRYRKVEGSMWVKSFTTSDVIKNNMITFANSAYVCRYILYVLYDMDKLGDYKIGKDFTDEDRANLDSIQNTLQNTTRPSLKLEHKSIDVKIVNGVIETDFTKEEEDIIDNCTRVATSILSGISDINANLKKSVREIDNLKSETSNNITENDIKMVTDTLTKVKNICKLTMKLVGSVNMKKIRNNAHEFRDKVGNKL
jgi:hypothetical protein